MKTPTLKKKKQAVRLVAQQKIQTRKKTAVVQIRKVKKKKLKNVMGVANTVGVIQLQTQVFIYNQKNISPYPQFYLLRTFRIYGAILNLKSALFIFQFGNRQRYNQNVWVAISASNSK